jgi:hypothetical protein
MASSIFLAVDGASMLRSSILLTSLLELVQSRMPVDCPLADMDMEEPQALEANASANGIQELDPRLMMAALVDMDTDKATLKILGFFC